MKPSTFLTLLPVVIAIVATHSSAFPEEPAPAPVIIAHRGASGYLPEHTLSAVAMAHALGADYIEQDVVLTKDHEPLVIHDLFLDHVTNVRELFPDRHREDGHFYVADFTLSEIRTLHVHERINPVTGQPQFPGRYPLGKGSFSLSTLAEHLELIQGLNRSTGRDVGVCVEIKEPAWHREQGFNVSRAVLDTLADYGYKTRQDKVLLQCFDLGEAQHLRLEMKTELRMVQLLNEKVWPLPQDATLEQIATEFQAIAEHADAIGPAVDLLLSLSRKLGAPTIAELIDMAHDAKLAVYCYTLRADALPREFASFAELAKTLTAARTDGFFTDHADKLRELLK